tara:strand:+ start:147 stop:857 length:711 start_codon:yes stop_codon:yes gene_type:complete
MFDKLTQEKLKHYVYCLVDRDSGTPFYVGMGEGNRVFDHVEQAKKEDQDGKKIKKIRATKNIEHVIIRHGLSEKEAFLLESVLIDFMKNYTDFLTNEIFGKETSAFGMLTTSEIISKYNAKPLEKFNNDVVLININKSYERAKGGKTIYEATKQCWVIGDRRKKVKYALSEYKGIIVEVYKINNWYECKRPNNKRKLGYGFDGEVAEERIRKMYINKSVKHLKKPGASSPIRYNLT